MKSRYRAFTLIELIVAMAIIMVLVGMAIYGVRKVTESSRTSATSLMMENGRSILAEYSRSAGAYPLPSQPLNFQTTVLPTPYYPADLSTDSAKTTAPTNPNDRFGYMTLYTRAVLGRAMQNATVRKMIDGLPPERLLQIPAGLDLIPAPPVVYPVAPPGYIPQMVVRYGPPGGVAPGIYPYLCIADFTDSAASPNAAARPRIGDLAQWYWLDLSIPSANLLDGFGNPLLYIPNGGFFYIDTRQPSGQQRRLMTSEGILMFPDAATDPYWKVGTGYTANTSYVIHSVNGRQYDLYRCVTTHTASAANAPGAVGTAWLRVPTFASFASAGPDGIFFDPARPETLDDNLYSFEN